MTVKRTKPSSSQRAVKRLHEQIDLLGEHKTKILHDFSSYKMQCEKILDAARRGEDRLKDALTNNNVKITELENQVANQYRENSGLRQDLEANAKRNLHQIQDIRELRSALQNTELDLIGALSDLDAARTSVSYRVYQWFSARVRLAKEIVLA